MLKYVVLMIWPISRNYHNYYTKLFKQAQVQEYFVKIIKVTSDALRKLQEHAKDEASLKQSILLGLLNRKDLMKPINLEIQQ